MAVSVFLVDDDPDFRRLMGLILRRETDVTVVGEAGDSEEAIELVRKLAPDVVLIDIATPSLGGLETTRQIKAEQPNTRVIVFASRAEDACQTTTGEIRVDAFLAEEQLLKRLLPTIRSVVGARPGKRNGRVA